MEVLKKGKPKIQEEYKRYLKCKDCNTEFRITKSEFTSYLAHDPEYLDGTVECPICNAVVKFKLFKHLILEWRYRKNG